MAVTIPADVSVSEGLPADGGDFERSADAVTESFCGTDGLPLAGVLDARRDGAVGPEFADLRDLRLYADDAAAHALLVRVREAADGLSRGRARRHPLADRRGESPTWATRRSGSCARTRPTGS